MRFAFYLILMAGPQAKGRIERLFKTFQDRLLKELRLHKISTIEKANEYLHNVFIAKFNKSFCRDPKDPEPAWRVVPGEINLDSVFSIKEQRTVMKELLWLIILCPGGVGYFRYCLINIESPLLRLK